MRYHVVLSRFIDFPSIEDDARAGLRPRHALKQLADCLSATVHFPKVNSGTLADRFRSQLIGYPHLWALARQIASDLSEQDVIYCSDEQIGLPLTALCSAKSSRPKVVVMINNVDRPRTRVAFKFWSSLRSANMYVSVSDRQLDFLRSEVGIDRDRTAFVPDQTDLQFFQPGPPARRDRPLLVSAGLERRDYEVLAEAVAGLDVDVCLTGFSADSESGNSCFPAQWPANFTRRRYEWKELVQLYTDADAVVVTLLPNIYAAGVTTMVEGMASGRPIIVTETEGLKGYLDDDDALTLVPPRDAKALRGAIVELLNSPATRAARGQRAAEIATERYGSDTHVETLAKILRGLGG